MPQDKKQTNSILNRKSESSVKSTDITTSITHCFSHTDQWSGAGILRNLLFLKLTLQFHAYFSCKSVDGNGELV